ncbi:MAG: monomethylamine:corrinoid methyltransferase [Clostridiales bacterium]|nr:monomethylamine:corrinoid methyltransferase [Clostridiales bacterium]
MNIFEVLRRAETGDYIKEDDFNMKLFTENKKLIAKYGIKYDKDNVIVDSDEMADSLFQAALELCDIMGFFCIDTNRIIRFSREELLLAMETAPKEMVLGVGKDARTMRARKVNDGYKMTVCGGCPGTPLPEELFLPIMMSYAAEPLLDIIIPGSLVSIEGMEVKTGGPLEIRATRQELIWTREAFERYGRPGTHIYAAGESSATALGTLAICNDRYMRTSDSHMIPVLSELKTDNIRLARVMTGLEYPAYTTSLMDPIIGGFAGGPEGAAIVGAAAIIFATAAYGVQMHCLHAIHNKYVAVSTREGMWMNSVIGRAFARNAPISILADAWTMCGTGTDELLYETAALALSQELSCLHTDALGATNGVYPNCSGLENRLFAEVVDSAFHQGMTAEQGNGLIRKLVAKYEHTFENPDFGVPFDEVYDIRKIVPLPAWQERYDRIKDELCKMGVEFRF